MLGTVRRDDQLEAASRLRRERRPESQRPDLEERPLDPLDIRSVAADLEIHREPKPLVTHAHHPEPRTVTNEITQQLAHLPLLPSLIPVDHRLRKIEQSGDTRVDLPLTRVQHPSLPIVRDAIRRTFREQQARLLIEVRDLLLQLEDRRLDLVERHQERISAGDPGTRLETGEARGGEYAESMSVTLTDQDRIVLLRMAQDTDGAAFLEDHCGCSCSPETVIAGLRSAHDGSCATAIDRLDELGTDALEALWFLQRAEEIPERAEEFLAEHRRYRERALAGQDEYVTLVGQVRDLAEDWHCDDPYCVPEDDSRYYSDDL